MDDALATIYTAHVTIYKLRYDIALAESKFDHAVIYSGGLHYQFVDDMPYPFKVNPHFKAWAPVTVSQNSQPRRPTTNGRIAFSQGLFEIGQEPLST